MQPGSRQYLSAVFYHNEEQQRLALRTRDQVAAREPWPITTEILPAGTFYVAEDYHQKFELRQHAALLKEFQAMYPDPRAFRDSTAAARVNGYLGGYGSRSQLEKEIDGWGLSATAQQELRNSCPVGR